MEEIKNNKIKENKDISDDIYLSDLILALRIHWLLIVKITISLFFISLLFVILATPRYTAQTVLKEQGQSQSTASSLASKFGGAASLAGIDLGALSQNDEDFLAIIKSRNFTRDVISTLELKKHIFSERWDHNNNNWRSGEKSGLASAAFWIKTKLAEWSGDKGWQPPNAEPSDWEAVKHFKEDHLSITKDPETQLITVSIEYTDPVLASRWANQFVELANNRIRADVIRDAQNAMDYLYEQLDTASVTGIRQTLFNLIESQLETSTVANTRVDYAFKVIDPAVVPEEKSFPKRFAILALSIVLGLLLGAATAVAIEGLRGTLVRHRLRVD